MSLRLSSRTTGNLSVVLAVCFIIVLALTGGASRGDEPAQIVVRLASVAMIAVAPFLAPRAHLAALKPLLAIYAVAVAVVAIQLVPLPPFVWTKLPGRAPFAEIAQLANMPQPWRPISLTPDFTRNSLLGLLVPGAAIACAAMLPPDRRVVIFLGITAVAIVSALLGIMQATGQQDSLVLYRIYSRDAPVGLFANRNHQAVLICATIPITAGIARWLASHPRYSLSALMLCGAFAILALPLILIAGSRAGLLLLPLSIVAAYLCFRTRSPSRPSRIARRYVVGGLILAAVAVAILALAVTWGRALSLERLISETGQPERRVVVTGTIMNMVWHYFPIGTGLGSFPEVFKIYEPFERLSPVYLNHAHNDLLELGLEWGIAGPLLALAVAWLWLNRTWVAWRSRSGTTTALLARVGSTVLLLLVLASLVDYPLRTPLLGAVAAFMLSFLLFFGDERSRLFRQRETHISRRDARHLGRGPGGTPRAAAADANIL